MPVRLIVGLLKGLVLGAFVGYGLAAAGFGIPGALVAYASAALLGVLVALVAGKPIWAKGARIEVGMKALAGALLAPGILWLVRRFVAMALPFDAGALPGLEALSGQSATVGTFAVTSLALVAATLAAFYDVDNQPEATGSAGKASAAAEKQRIAASSPGEEVDAEAEAAESEAAEQKRRS
jgi:hypothetical protein